jgi:DNA-binding transcriptional MerR regulator
MKMKKRKFRIGELARQLGIERFVVRFWEKEFNLRTDRSEGGQRFYSEDDLATFTTIKILLYEQGFTITGAKQQLKENKGKKVPIIGSQKTTIETSEIQELKKDKESLEKQVLTLQKQLIKLRELL